MSSSAESPALSADRIIPAALSAGLLTADDVVQHTVEVRAIGRSHSVFRLSVDGRPKAVLKSFGPRRGDTDGELAREVAVAVLGERVPDVAALLPPRLRWAGVEPVIVTAFVAGDVAWSVDGLGTGRPGSGPDWRTLMGALAPRLAAMHRATHGLTSPDPALLAPMPWGLRLFDGDASADLWASPLLVGVLAPLGLDASLVVGVRRARGAWRVRCLIHGDLKHDNVLVRQTEGGLALTVVDWEMARLGDPAWDLAALLVRPLLAEAPSGVAWTDEIVASAAALVATYSRAARLPQPAIAQRLVLYSGVWLVMTALQYLSTLPGVPAEGELAPMLGAARITLDDTDQLTARIIAAADGIVA